jgi:hypothetical protein
VDQREQSETEREDRIFCSLMMEHSKPIPPCSFSARQPYVGRLLESLHSARDHNMTLPENHSQRYPGNEQISQVIVVDFCMVYVDGVGWRARKSSVSDPLQSHLACDEDWQSSCRSGSICSLCSTCSAFMGFYRGLSRH